MATYTAVNIKTRHTIKGLTEEQKATMVATKVAAAFTFTEEHHAEKPEVVTPETPTEQATADTFSLKAGKKK